MAGLYQDSCVDKPAGGHGMDAENKTTSCVDKPADGHGPKGSSGNFMVPVPGETLTVAAVGNKEMFLRPCVDCGLITGSFCDECTVAVTRCSGDAQTLVLPSKHMWKEKLQGLFCS